MSKLEQHKKKKKKKKNKKKTTRSCVGGPQSYILLLRRGFCTHRTPLLLRGAVQNREQNASVFLCPTIWSGVQTALETRTMKPVPVVPSGQDVGPKP
jgi:hypothetical protein